mgnify:CR=1 FL=1
MAVIAYLKQQCGWSRGVREVLAKYGIEYEERQIHEPKNFQEMVDKTGQTNQPCVQLEDNLILADISGEELQDYLMENGHDNVDTDENVPLDRSCTDAEHQQQQRQNGEWNTSITTGGSHPHIPIKDTGFYEGG